MYYAFTPNSVFKLVPPFGLRIYLINQYVILRYYSSNLCKWHYLYGVLPFFMTERLHFHFSLSGIGEGNGNAPQYSWLDNPRNGGVWWAAIYGVTQSRTRLKGLSSSSSMAEYWAKQRDTETYNNNYESVSSCCTLRMTWNVLYEEPLLVTTMRIWGRWGHIFKTIIIRVDQRGKGIIMGWSGPEDGRICTVFWGLVQFT